MEEKRFGRLVLRDWTAQEAKVSFDKLLDSARSGCMNRIVTPEGLYFVRFVATQPIATEEQLGPPITEDELRDIFGLDEETLEILRRSTTGGLKQ